MGQFASATAPVRKSEPVPQSDPDGSDSVESSIVIQKWWRRVAQKKMLSEHKEHIGELADWKCQTLRFLYYPMSNVKDPSQLSTMTGELFLLLVVISLVLTGVFHPEMFNDNPIKKLLGYNNICIAFDMAPALYVAAFLWTVIVWVSWEYVRCTLSRLIITRKRRKKAGEKQHPFWLFCAIVCAHVTYGLSTSIFILCFVISPFHDVPGHTRPFLVYMVAKGLSSVAFVTDRVYFDRVLDHVPSGCVQYTAFLMILSLILPVNFELNVWYSNKFPDRAEPFTPWYISFALDWLWMGSNVASAHFFPRPRLVVGRKVIHAKTLDTLKSHFHSSEHRRLSRFKKFSMRRSAHLTPPDKLYRAAKIDPRAESPLQRQDSSCHVSSATTNEVCAVFGRMASAARSTPQDWGYGATVATMRAKFTIDARHKDLAAWNRTGFFAEPGVYEAIVRINVAEHGAVRVSLRVDVPESMEVLEGSELVSAKPGYKQVDFLMAEEFKQFFVPSVPTLLAAASVGEAPSVRGVVSNLKGLLRAVRGINYSKQNLNIAQGIFGKNYYAGLPFKIGAGAAKFGLQACQSDVLSGTVVAGLPKPGESMTGKESEVTDMYRANFNVQKTKVTGPKWDFVVQVAKHHPSHKIDIGDSRWNEDVSPYVAVGSLQILTKEKPILDPDLKFNPWNQLRAHEPLGPLNLARRDIYRAHQEGRLQTHEEMGGRVCPVLRARSPARVVGKVRE